MSKERDAVLRLPVGLGYNTAKVFENCAIPGDAILEALANRAPRFLIFRRELPHMPHHLYTLP